MVKIYFDGINVFGSISVNSPFGQEIEYCIQNIHTNNNNKPFGPSRLITKEEIHEILPELKYEITEDLLTESPHQNMSNSLYRYYHSKMFSISYGNYLHFAANMSILTAFDPDIIVTTEKPNSHYNIRKTRESQILIIINSSYDDVTRKTTIVFNNNGDITIEEFINDGTGMQDLLMGFYKRELAKALNSYFAERASNDTSCRAIKAAK